ncbi:NADH-FMN oxidoreductase RutF, flavin reductase (DIM6/NTAB) family [Celeribacter neptunius]|uniref:NADH-FMN oxidoreductase RutF, flavin reductase (DIM6/NTAB) family n=2 Tax=Celeribacter neptunius TaxID=588602 RepID=A0A1I3NYB6_9RHOB|nr:NADH-FMN oxidoreductase RutF, flavin reductase (DIM6/NTAB) family [Celeribacter neptunius]
MIMSTIFPEADVTEGLKSAMRLYASGVTVITAGQGAGRRGLTATAFTSVTMDPPTVLVCVNRNGQAHDAIVENGHFCVNVLCEEARDVAESFAGMTGKTGADQFEGFEWIETRVGAPAYAFAQAAVACKLTQTLETASHSIFIGEVCEAATNPDRTPLLHFNRGFHAIGALK